MEHNIVQVEYFMIDTGGDLERLQNECEERKFETLPDSINGISDTGPGIKTCLRFFDTDGSITRLVNELDWWAKERRLMLTQPAAKKRWSRFLSWLWSNYIDQGEQDCRNQLRHKLIPALVANKNIAIEIWDHRYRPLSANEKHEVLEKIKPIERFWVFVFAPNHLLADNNKIIASVM